MRDKYMPKGFTPIRGYTNGEEIVLCGVPDAPPDGAEETSAHNCDEMGCGSIDHVILRIRLAAHQRRQIATDIRERNNEQGAARGF